MTNYNERLSEILEDFYDGDIRQSDMGKAKQAITSLIKELVEEAKPELPALFAGLGDISVTMYKKGTDQFEQNLLKALEEV